MFARRKLTVIAAVMAILLVPALACDSGGSGTNVTSASFALTDAPVDDLSAFQVELTKVEIVGANNSRTTVFPVTPNATITVNLLQLVGVNQLLGNVALANGAYKEIVLEFDNAVAVDVNLNPLTVLPQTSGSVTIKLSPPAVVSGGSTFFLIDFDVNASISNLVTGSGGALTLSPVVFARERGRPNGPAAKLAMRDIKGTIDSVDTDEIVLRNVSGLGNGTIRVKTDGSTEVEVNDVEVVGPADLTAILTAGMRVEVEGSYDTTIGAVRATEIEECDGDDDGREIEGVVTAIGTGTFDIHVIGSGDSGLAVGSTQTVTHDAGTTFVYDDPDGPADKTDLVVGQAVEVEGSSASALDAEEVELSDTQLRGTVTAVNGTQFTLDVTTVERVAVGSLTNFSNPVTVETGQTVTYSVNDTVEVEGHFNRTTVGIFDAASTDDDDDDDDAEIEGETFSVAGTAPLTLSVTGEGEGLGLSNPATITVELGANVTIIEKDEVNDTVSLIDAATLEAGITAGTYDEIEAEGSFDAGSNTLTARKIKVEIDGDDDDDNEFEGETYVVSTTSPLEFTLTGDGEDFGLGSNVSVTIVPASGAIFSKKVDGSGPVAMTEAEFATALDNGDFEEVEVTGTYDSTTNTITADRLKGEIDD
jgi:hypothetical protein